MDIRTVAGRLGHGGGGSTILRVYAAWLSEADQRAADGLFSRMPARPKPVDPLEPAKADPQTPYEKLAAQIPDQILDGGLPADVEAPTIKELAATHQVSTGTAHRVLDLLKTWGLVTGASRGRRGTSLRPDDEQAGGKNPQPKPLAAARS